MVGGRGVGLSVDVGVDRSVALLGDKEVVGKGAE